MSDLLVAGLAHRYWSVGVVAGEWNASGYTAGTEHFTTLPAMELKIDEINRLVRFASILYM